MFSVFAPFAGYFAGRSRLRAKRTLGSFASRLASAARFAAFTVFVLFGSAAAANAACDFTSGSQSAATIAFATTGAPGQIGFCVTDPLIEWGLYSSPNGATNPNTDAYNNYPMGTGGLTLSNMTITTAKAVYQFVPVFGSGPNQVSEYDITMTSFSGTGTDTITLWYANQCTSDLASPQYTCGPVTPPPTPATTNTSFTITVNLPAAPAVTSLNPAAGPTGAGNSVVITGSGFFGTTGAASVKFGANNATSYNVDSATQITAVAPAGSAGTVDVRVTNNAQTSAIAAADQYTYVTPPTATSLDVTAGPTTGGTSVTVTGTDFVPGSTSVTIGGTVVPAASVTVNSATSLTFSTPVHAAGSVAVTVTTSGGTTGAVPGGFTYLNTPTTASLAPAFGTSAGGTSVTVSGSNFAVGATSVTIGGTTVPASSVTVNSSTSLTINTPAHAAGNVAVTVTTSGGTSNAVAGGFTYEDAPTAASLTPTAGPTGGGTSVTVTGTNFVAGDTGVTIGGTTIPVASVTVNSATSLTFSTPAHVAGNVAVFVSTSGGSSGNVAGGYTYVAAPTVTSIAPISGPGGGATPVVITGTNFTGATTVTFGATAATFNIDSATQITATSPAGSGLVDVRVTTAGGTSATTAADQFTYIPAPTVTSISPTAGSTVGGTIVTITGTNFTGATAVQFGATAATGFTFVSATSLTATAPAGTGTVDIRVTTPGGTSAVSAADQFTYVTAPTVTSISPSAGPQIGGTTVIITGANLSGATAVVFGGTSATGITVNSSTQITATSPAGTGTVDVRITTVGGTSAIAAADQFTYVAAPTVSLVSPTSGPGGGGTTVTITGTNLSNATAVTFGATPAAALTLVSATTVTATSPPGTGLVDVRVTTAGGTSATSAADQFTYIPAPAVTSISPTSGPAAGGTTVTITGTNFTGVTAVIFGTTAAGFTFNSATSITAVSPAGTGIADVKVTTPGGTSATSAGDQFTYISPPAIASVSPTSGLLAGGTSVTLTGSGFSGATAVAFGATAATGFTVNSATSITAVSPAGTGTVDIKVTAPGGISATTAADQFTYLAAPVVTSIAPNVGATGGGTSVILTGTGFTNATAVTFGATAATGFTVNSTTQITATSPPGAGIVDIRVTTAGGTSAAAAADQFTYVIGPVVIGISPASGPAPGGTSVTVTGSGFTGATAVKFGANNASTLTINSANQITATSPAGTGAVDITVTTAGGTSATSAADQFTYLAAPTVTSLTPNTGPPAGGTAVTISGTDFTAVTAVKFGAANAAGFTVNSATSITATSPAGVGTVDVTVTANAQTSAMSAADRFSYSAVTTATALVSSQNPSTAGQAVTFTATVTGPGGVPTGSVTFNDAGTAIGTAVLAGGTATFSTSSLVAGTHPITASYGGSAVYQASTSPTLTQTVNIPADSARLRALQVTVSKLVSQNSGQAISGAVDSAISEGFSEAGQFMMPSANGMRFNFAADEAAESDGQTRAANAYSRASAEPTGRGAVGRGGRIDDAFAALDKPVAKAPPTRWREPKQWMFWTELRGTGIDRWGSVPTNLGTPITEANLRGSQLNLVAGLTYKPAANFLIGLLGGYETFSYTEQDINGKLKGDGWTVGGYAGWKITDTLRWDAAVAYSGIGYNGAAGTATGNFSGDRWLASTGLTGTYTFDGGLMVEPSLKVYALWEQQAAYTDSLGTLQSARDFSTGRASAGLKLAHPVGWWDSVQLVPFVGLYGDYYFTQDNSVAITLAGGIPLASTPLLDGWSARMTGGIGARFDSGVMLSVGGELGGLGSNTQIWTLTGRARVPFSAR